MSGKVTGQVWELDLSRAQQWVLLAMADNAHDDGSKCYPGVAYLSWKTGYCERQVRRILRELEEAELIKPTAHQKGGRGHATEYKIQVEKGVKKSPYRSVKADISDTKGDIGSIKGDIQMSPQQREPSVEPLVVPTTIYSKVIQDCLTTLSSLDGYPKNERQNAEHLEKQCERHPGLDIRREVEKFRNHYEEQGFEKKHKPRARLSTWLDNAKDWSRNSYAEPVRSSVAGYRRFD